MDHSDQHDEVPRRAAHPDDRFVKPARDPWRVTPAEQRYLRERRWQDPQRPARAPWRLALAALAFALTISAVQHGAQLLGWFRASVVELVHAELGPRPVDPGDRNGLNPH